ncbi:MAG: CHAT domain-containing protein [Bacteroidota bacterium]
MDTLFAKICLLLLLCGSGWQHTWAQSKAEETYLQGVRYYYETQFDSCVIYAKKAEKLAIAAAEPSLQLKAGMMTAKSMLVTGKYQAANDKLAEYVEFAEANFEASDPLRHWFMDRYGEHQVNINLFQEGLKTHQAVLKARQQTTSIPDTALANSYFFIAQDLSRLGEFDSALVYGEKSLRIREAELDPKDRNLGILYNLLGVIANETYELETSNQYYYQALDNFLSREDSSNLAVLQILNNIGSNKIFLHQFEEAIDLLKAPLPYLDNLPLENQLSFLYNLGMAYNSFGDYEQAIFYLKQSSGLNTPGTPFFAYMRMWIDFELARTHFRRQETEQAYGLIQSVRRRAESPDAIPDADVGLIYFLEGDILFDLKRYDDALESQLLAEQAFLENYGPDYYLLGEVYYEKGQYFDAKKDYAKAITAYDQALELYQTEYSDYYDEIGITLSQKASMYRKMGEIKLDMYEQALGGYFPDLASFDPLDTEHVLANWCCFYLDEVLLETAQAYRESFDASQDQNELLQAWRFFETSINLTDSFRYQFQDKASRRDWTRQYLDLYEGAIETAIKLYEVSGEEQYLHEALSISEKNKAWTLREAILDQQAIQFSGIPEAIQAEERRLRQELAYLKQQIEELEDSTLISEFQARQLRSQQNYLALIDQLEQQYPTYYQLKYVDPSLDVPALQNALAVDQVMYHYFLGEEDWVIFRIDRGGVEPFIINGKALTDLQKASEAWRRFLSSPPDQSGGVPLAAGNLLFEKLLPAYDTAQQQLLIIPDGELGYLPFGTLLSAEASSEDYRRLPYLIREAAIAYQSSAGLWLDGKKQKVSKANMTYLGIAPSFGEGAGFAERREDSPGPLQYNGDEVALVVKLWSGKVVNGYGGGKESLFRDGPRSRVIHLATHAEANEAEPLRSRLFFSGEEEGSTESLYASEIFNLRLDAEMVVLSACETGLGQLHRGEGILSLSRAFQYAGARSLLTTLWRSDDLAALKLSEQLFPALAAEQNKAEALRQSKLALLASDDPLRTHPYYWAGSVLIGDERPLDNQSPWQQLWWIAFPILIILGFGLYMSINEKQA